jgi:hypothetical protein
MLVRLFKHLIEALQSFPKSRNANLSSRNLCLNNALLLFQLLCLPLLIFSRVA